MTHFHLLSTETLEFLIQLKSINGFWYMTLLNCAKKNPKLAKKCIEEAKQHLKYASLNIEHVNPFEISHAVNSGLLTNDAFHSYIDDTAWHVRQAIVIRQMQESYNALK